MNEFDALSLIVDTAIKHGNHNQKLHGRRFGPDTGGGGGGGGSSLSILAEDIAEIPFSKYGSVDSDAVEKSTKEKYRTLGENMTADTTEDEKKNIHYYQGEAYEAINGYLSGRITEHPDMDKIQAAVESIDGVMERSRVPADTVVLRGVSMTDPARLAELTTVGSVIERKGYLSTSVNVEVAADFADYSSWNKEKAKVIMHIKVPAGSKAIHVCNNSNSLNCKYDVDNERELLLPRNSKMVVRGVRVQKRIRKNPFSGPKEVEDEIIHVDVELLP